MVFDDISFLTDEQGRQFVREQLSREDCFVVVSGRVNIPKWLKPYYYEHPFRFIEEEDLKLTVSELIQFFEKYGINLSDEHCRQIYI